MIAAELSQEFDRANFVSFTIECFEQKKAGTPESEDFAPCRFIGGQRGWRWLLIEVS